MLLASALADTLTSSTIPFADTIDVARFSYSASQHAMFGSSGCADQLMLLDITALNPSQYPSLSRWAAAALLWAAAMSEDFSGTLAKSIARLDLGRLPISDQAMDFTQRNLRVTQYGFTFDIGQRTVTPDTTLTASLPSSDQNGRLTATELGAFTNISILASAASELRSGALSNYWQDTLQLPASQLDTFLTSLRSSNILLPVDAVGMYKGSTYAELALASANSNTACFPPPLVANTALTADQRSAVIANERKLLGLSSSAANLRSDGRPGIISLVLSFALLIKSSSVWNSRFAQHYFGFPQWADWAGSAKCDPYRVGLFSSHTPCGSYDPCSALDAPEFRHCSHQYCSPCHAWGFRPPCARLFIITRRLHCARSCGGSYQQRARRHCRPADHRSRRVWRYPCHRRQLYIIQLG